MQTPHGSRIGTTPSSACSPSVPGETVCGTHLVATSQLNEGLTEQRHTVPMILTDMMHYFVYETYSRLQLNERFKRFPVQIQVRDVSALQSLAAIWALTGCGCSGCTNPPRRHGIKQVCKGFLWLRKGGVMGTAGTGQPKLTPFASPQGGKGQRCIKENWRRNSFTLCWWGHNTKQPWAVSSSPRTLNPSESPLLTETGGWLEHLAPQSPSLK